MIFLLVVDNFCLNENYLNFINIVKIEKLGYLDCKFFKLDCEFFKLELF